MATVFLLLDDERKIYFELEKFYLVEAARQEQPFESFWREANEAEEGYEPPETTNRFEIAEREAKAIYTFCVGAAWKIRLVGDCWDDPEPSYGDARRTYEMVGSIDSNVQRGICVACGGDHFLVSKDGACSQCDWGDRCSCTQP